MCMYLGGKNWKFTGNSFDALVVFCLFKVFISEGFFLRSLFWDLAEGFCLVLRVFERRGRGLNVERVCVSEI